MSGPEGGLLWQVLRDVSLWARTEQERRGQLFVAGAAAARSRAIGMLGAGLEIASDLDELLEVVRAPSEVQPERIATACKAVAGWAAGRGARATALAYSQAAALTLPDDPATSYAVGIRARRAAEYGRAESWFRRAVMLARQRGDWNVYARAFVALGNLYVQRGNYPTARKLQMRARRTSRRHGLRGVEGMALHDLFIISMSSGNIAEAEEFAGGALRAYGAGHKRLPVLAHDVAYAWLEQGHFARALPVFEATLPHIQQPAERLHVVADIARAAGALQDSRRFEQAWAEGCELLALPEALEARAQALSDLAGGAASVREWDRAEDAASQALDIALSRGETKIQFAAEALLDSVRARRAAARPIAAPLQTTPAEGADALATAFVRKLALAGV